MARVDGPDDLPTGDDGRADRDHTGDRHTGDRRDTDRRAADPRTPGDPGAGDRVAPDPMAPDPTVPVAGAPRDPLADDEVATDDAEQTPAQPVREPAPLTQQIGRVAIVILAILFGIFAVVNSQFVDFSWVFGETHVRPDPAGEGEIGGVPLIVLLVAAFVIGALLGALIQWYTARSRKARRRR